MRAEPVRTCAGVPTGGGARCGLGARCPRILPGVARARVADTGTWCGLPAAVPMCWRGPAAYPDNAADRAPLRAGTGAAPAGTAVMTAHATVAVSATARSHARDPNRRLRLCRDDQRVMMHSRDERG